MIPVTTLRPFTRMLMTIGQIPTSYLISMSYEEQLLWLCNFLEKEVIPALNNNAEAVKEVQELYTELKSYVDNYFENLDVQEEINNKLDEMAESGQLTDIIAQYLGLAGVLAFDTISNMASATNIAEGSICRTLGETTYNDGKGAFYKVRTITSSDVIDGVNIVALTNYPTLIAELIPNAEIDNLKKEYDKNVIFKNYYEENSNIYILELNNIEKLEVLSTNGSKTTPGGANIKNVKDYISSNEEDYNIYCNCAIFNASNGNTIGYSLFNGTGYESSIESNTDVVCFDEDNMMSSIDSSETSLSELEANYVNAFTGFKSIIKNNEDVTPITNLDGTIKFCLGQLTNNNYILVVAYSRKPLNDNISWSDLRTFLKTKYSIKELCALDGGGSVQIYNKDFSLIPSTDISNYLGRKIPVILGIKVKEEDLL